MTRRPRPLAAKQFAASQQRQVEILGQMFSPKTMVQIASGEALLEQMVAEKVAETAAFSVNGMMGQLFGEDMGVIAAALETIETEEDGNKEDRQMDLALEEELYGVMEEKLQIIRILPEPEPAPYTKEDFRWEQFGILLSGIISNLNDHLLDGMDVEEHIPVMEQQIVSLVRCSWGIDGRRELLDTIRYLTLKLGPFTLFARLPGSNLKCGDEKIQAMLEYYANHIEITYTPPKPKRNVSKYKLPKFDDPVLKFKNLNFKLAVMNVLMYEKGLLEPQFSIWEFADEYTRRKIDPGNEGYDSMIPETAEWFKCYPVPARLAPEVTEIDMDGGDEVNCQLAPGCAGEDNLFDINAIDEDELRQFPNLRRASIFTDHESSVVPVFRRCGIEVVSAYDIPFQIDEEKAQKI